MTKIAVVMPALNAEATLERTIADLPSGRDLDLILGDDASSDRTVEIALGLGIHVVRHAETLGYGANQKTCYQEALRRDAEIIVMVHPDYQYDARLVGIMIDLIKANVCDIVLGNRIRTRSEALGNGMPVWKYFVNRTSTFFENLVLGQSLGDFHSGFRAYSREALELIPFMENSDDFVFDQEILIQATFFGLRLGDFPVPVRYMPEASSINIRRSLRYGFSTLLCLIAYFMQKCRLRVDRRFMEDLRS